MEDKKYTFEELVDMIAQTLENLTEASVPKGMEREVAQGLSDVEGLTDFLKATMSADMRRYFAATPEEQKIIKGHFTMATYLLGLARSGKDLRDMK